MPSVLEAVKALLSDTVKSRKEYRRRSRLIDAAACAIRERALMEVIEIMEPASDD